MRNIYAVIMAGGRGERFWPLSTDDLPKPFIRLLGEETLLQQAVRRLESLVRPEEILIVLGSRHLGAAREQLSGIPEGNFIVEPAGRDTAACLGYAALHVERRDGAALMLALPADHHIADSEAFRRTMQKGIEALEGAAAVVFGMVPDRPDTGYGYIQAEKPALPRTAWPVMRFVEKPDAPTAARYLEAGNFFWNSGMFLWENRTLLDLFRRHLPRTSDALDALRPLVGLPDTAVEQARIFAGIERISIDYGIIEKAKGLRMVPAEFEWDDVGNWASLARALPRDAEGNVARGSAALVEARDNITYSDAGTVALFGVEGLVVVQAHGRVLVCPKARAGELKKLIRGLGPAGA